MPYGTSAILGKWPIINSVSTLLVLRGGGGVQAYLFGKNDFELGVGGEGQDTSRHIEGSFWSIRAILPM